MRTMVVKDCRACGTTQTGGERICTWCGSQDVRYRIIGEEQGR